MLRVWGKRFANEEREHTEIFLPVSPHYCLFGRFWGLFVKTHCKKITVWSLHRGGVEKIESCIFSTVPLNPRLHVSSDVKGANFGPKIALWLFRFWRFYKWWFDWSLFWLTADERNLLNRSVSLKNFVWALLISRFPFSMSLARKEKEISPSIRLFRRHPWDRACIMVLSSIYWRDTTDFSQTKSYATFNIAFCECSLSRELLLKLILHKGVIKNFHKYVAENFHAWMLYSKSGDAEWVYESIFFIWPLNYSPKHWEQFVCSFSLFFLFPSVPWVLFHVVLNWTEWQFSLKRSHHLPGRIYCAGARNKRKKSSSLLVQ